MTMMVSSHDSADDIRDSGGAGTNTDDNNEDDGVSTEEVHVQRGSRTVVVEIHENERAWIGKGFSKAGLLPNDRGRYSTTDGSLSWKTADEAFNALLTTGWTYDNDNKKPSSLENHDDDDQQQQVPHQPQADDIINENEKDKGWMYARDFTASAVKHAQTTRRGALHWVRFCKLVKKKYFVPESCFCHSNSDDETISDDQHQQHQCYCVDSKEQDRLSEKLLHVLAYTSLVVRHNNFNNNSHSDLTTTYSVALPIKKKILNVLQQQQQNNNEVDDAFRNLTILHNLLDNVAIAERTLPIHILSKLPSFLNRHSIGGWKERCQFVNDVYFSKYERDLISKVIIRNLDKHFQLHCNNNNVNDDGASSSCGLVRVPCPNQGCPDTMSKTYLDEHDASCRYKVISCTCGDEFFRHQYAKHLTDICPLRETECPFANKIGCSKVVPAQDMAQHVADDIGSHLLLAVNRMMEYQDIIKTLNVRTKQLEQDNTNLRKALQSYRETSKKEIDAANANVVSLGKKLTALESSNNKEFKRIREHSRERKRSHAK